MRQNPHAAVVQRVENRVGKTDASKGCLDIVVCQKVNGTSRYKASETRRTYSGSLCAHLWEGWRGFQFKRTGDRSGFPVVKCLSNGAGDEAGKMLHPGAAKLYDL